MNSIRRTEFIIASSVAIVTFIVFLPTLQNGFIGWDDNAYVYENYFIRSLDIKLLKSAFTVFHAGYWCPLIWFSHAVDYAIWGLNPLGHHLTNNILHTLNTSLAVFLVMRLIKVFKKTAENNGQAQPFLDDRLIWITGAITGLLFGLHPVHVESVAWVAERKDLLCAFFFLLTIYTYTNYVSELSTYDSIKPASCFFNKRYLFTVGFFILSLLSKPMAVTLPFVLMILDWYPFRRMQSRKSSWAAFIEKLPFIVLSIASSTITILAQKEAVGLKQLVPLPMRLLVAAKSLIAYMGKMVLPLNLIPYYPYPQNISILSLEYIVPIVFVVGITMTCLAVARKQKLWISVWSYYLITLVPVLGIIQVGTQSMADRFTYLPSLGPFFITGLIAAKLYEKATSLERWKSISKIASLFVALVMLVSISYDTIRQIGIWKNSIVFWDYVIDKEHSQVPLAYNNLGIAYQSQGLFDMAMEQYQTALRLKPDYADAYINLGNAYQSQGLFDMAIEQYQAALRLKPDYAEAYNNLGNAYQYKGLFDIAIEQYQAALRLKPDDVKTYYNLGMAYQSKSLFDMAIEQYRIVLSLQPNFAEAHFNVGWCYLEKGFIDTARREYELGLKIKPDDYSARRVFESIISNKQ